MDTSKLHTLVSAHLRMVGWNENRNVDINDAISYLESRGLSASPVVRSILGSLNGITLNPVTGDKIILDVVKASENGVDGVESIPDWELSFFQRRLGECCIPFGYSSLLSYLLSESGRVVSFRDNWYVVSESIYDFLWRSLTCSPSKESFEIIDELPE